APPRGKDLPVPLVETRVAREPAPSCPAPCRRQGSRRGRSGAENGTSQALHVDKAATRRERWTARARLPRARSPGVRYALARNARLLLRPAEWPARRLAARSASGGNAAPRRQWSRREAARDAA